MKNLSKLLPLLLVLLTIAVSSCNNDDEPEISPIVGTWNYSDYQLNISINGLPLVQFFQTLGATPQEAAAAAAEVLDDTFSAEDFEGTTLEFRADGTYEIRVNGNLDEAGTYELLNGNTLLRLSAAGDSTDFQVRTLSNNQLTIELVEEESDDFLDIGLPVLVRLQLELSFVK
ncbi:lipocalin family protein [Mongoliitalea daihaiensis]|uniref:lipocalin family protein n=1 Tax=Mongoliitalea daihaiensis TaxID=2782006 RepID=UPI001F2BFD9F|nr:lipocalin family protein [Mongoliitalea daihaiensis]UJP65532.1 lipocalin family protein [Mongoliitalea daihaiensis]